MVDNISVERRSYNMSRIRAGDTKPELLIRHYLHHHGFRYRIHVNSLPGRPDIVLKKYSAVVFIHGCFWHHHQDCILVYTSKTRTEYWL